MKQFAHPQGPTIHTSHSLHILAGSLLVGWLLNLLPWRVDFLWLRPDFLLLATLYWAIYQPARIGVGTAWWLGLLTDFSDSAHPGQHAIGYALAVYVLTLFQRRLYNFPPWQQALPIMAFLLIEQVSGILVATFMGDSRDVLPWLASLVTGTLVWVPWWGIMHRLQVRTPPHAP